MSLEEAIREAVREADVESFPLAAVAFITDNPAEQTDQFLLVNSAKPLSKSLIYELLPNTQATLSVALQRRKAAASLLTALNARSSSPFRGLIQTTTCPSGYIKDTSVLKMLEASLTDGALYELADEADRLQVLESFWGAVAERWPTAWKQPPKRSRLTHGVGIGALGFLMDAIAARAGKPTRAAFARGISLIDGWCHWTEGEWLFGGGQRRRWNELQNTGADIRLVGELLTRSYQERTQGRREGSSKSRAFGLRGFTGSRHPSGADNG
jgi:hypothetical protein